MAQQTVNIGTTANDGTGDTLRAAFTKLNANEAELYAGVSAAQTTASGAQTAATAVGTLLAQHYQMAERIIGGHHIGLALGSSNTYAGTTRTTYVAKGPFSRIRLVTRNGRTSGLAESPADNAVIEAASIEKGSTAITFQRGGQRVWVNDANAALGYSDPAQISVQAGDTFYVRLHRRVPKPPQSPTAAASAGGALTSGTTYFYKTTTVDQGIESIAGTEVSASPSSTNLSVTLAWTAPTYGDKIRVYRGTATGAETFLIELPATATGYVDNGYLSTTPGVTPPSTQPVYRSTSGFLPFGVTSNTGSANAQTDVTQATGSITGTSGIGGAPLVSAAFLVGDDTTSASVVGLGDSILAYTGIWIAQGGVSVGGQSQDPLLVNWFCKGLSTAGGINYVNCGFPSTRLSDLITALYPHKARLGPTAYARNILCEHGFNDLTSADWTVLAANQLKLAQVFYAQGKRYFITTVTPRISTTDGFLTLANMVQASGAQETLRQSYNNWVRGGFQVDGSGNPVVSGGTRSPYISGYFDLANVIEVNASGVTTLNGGYWRVPSAATLSGTFGSGSTATALVTSTTLTTSAHAGKVIKITSGTLAGQTALIQANGTATITAYASGATSETGFATWGGLSAGPASGDTFEVWDPYVVDGIHPSLAGHALIATAFAAWASLNLVNG